uniref:Uncharacterized protein n=1 Tax=Chromera velia CCMP2878 TaxID=1169474 RepID=A0A0G4HGZ4_9ALVE|eukprot:Cvel_6808.t1-p1 / transcript=Cvel_6808.t1 / gene=Cvel_6808 / organism=Chromera_velia_CCMP2878 / gene_product=hypothetical protein / transcript_product=hypothetical protein / location=Cvel_scaffold343:12149-17136(+) / protein_length=963 / sequence_SO=supercontig / SO=protein_coding / is_pseudo=false
MNSAQSFQSCASGAANAQTQDRLQPLQETALCALFDYARPTAKEISKLVSHRNGFGLALVLLQFIRTKRSLLPFASLDLSGFSLSAGKLRLLVKSLPRGPFFVETLKCGPHVCKDPCLIELLNFLFRLKAAQAKGVPSICLRTLDVSKCDLGDEAGPLFPRLPRVLEHLDLRGNRLREASMKTLGDVLWDGGLPNLLSLDVSDNPLGPLGVAFLAKGLAVPSWSWVQPIPLQSLKLARTKAWGAGVVALGNALKRFKLQSLQVLDLEGNDMQSEGLKSLLSAFRARAVPRLRVLVLKNNELRDCFSLLTELLSTSMLKDLEELDLQKARLSEVVETDEAADVAAIPKCFPKLRRLNLGGIQGAAGARLNSSQLRDFACALGGNGESCASLEELVIPNGGGCPYTPEGVEALAEAFRSGRLSNLRVLKMSNRHDLTGETFPELCRSLAVGGRVSLLETLELFVPEDENAEEGVRDLSEAIRRGGLCKLRNLKLNFFTCVGRNSWTLSELGLALGGGKCLCLETLDLRWKEVGDEGVGGLADGLGMGGLPSLRHLYLEIRCGQRAAEEGGGCVSLGEILSTNKVPSLRSVYLDWTFDESFAALCEGLSRGSVSPPLLVEMWLEDARGPDSDGGAIKLAEVIRAGKLSGLRTLRLMGFDGVSRPVGVELGEAMTHSAASLHFLEEMGVYWRGGCTADFLEGLSRGTGSLPRLHTFSFPHFGSTIGTVGAQSLSALMAAGRVPALRDLTPSLNGIREEGMQAFAAALSSPNVTALRNLELKFGVADGAANVVAHVNMLSVVLSSGRLRRLEDLCLSGLGTIEEVLSLCVGLGSGELSSLRKLQIRDSKLGVEGGRALSEVLIAQKLPCLRAFGAQKAMLTDGGVSALLDGWTSRDPPPLHHLNFLSNSLTNEVVDPLLRLFDSQRVPALESVNLDCNSGIEYGRGKPGRLLRLAFQEMLSEDYDDIW